MFKALILEQQEKKTIADIRQIDESMLPDNNVLIDVNYSSLNFKDGLAITGKGRIVKEFPIIPGIDLAGTVLESKDPRYNIGDNVVLTGWGVGESHWGGMAEKACLKADWLVPQPRNITSKQAMMVGTAGLTAMLCVQALIDAGVKPENGEILVTGASGGVGSVAVTLLAQLGYNVVAATGRMEENGQLLTSLGATHIIDRSELQEPARPLDKQRWAGAVDTAGSNILAKLLTQMNYGGAVAACGLAAGFDLPTTVMPFILRGVKLLGIDSVSCPYEKRIKAWDMLVKTLPESFYQTACKEVTLEQVPEVAEAITNGQITGRIVIKI